MKLCMKVLANLKTGGKMSDMKNAFAEAMKKKLKDDGISSEWMEKHLIIETIGEIDVKKRRKKSKKT